MGSSLGEVIKKMAIGANDANAPTSVLFGVVTSVEPLEITVEQKLKLTKEFLVLTKNVKDYTVDVTVAWDSNETALNANHNHNIEGGITINSTATVNPNPDNERVEVKNEIDNSMSISQKNINLRHSHSISGKKKMTIHNSLKLNDNVILIQQQGGNNFIVIDKI